MKSNPYSNSMLSPNIDPSSPLIAILHKSAGYDSAKPFAHKKELYWTEQYYKLDKSSYFQSLSSSIKEDILLDLNHQTLSLSYYIEKFGLNYGAKMTLQAETTEEKSLYSLFGADEVKHRLWIEDFLYQLPPSGIDFHPLLNSLGVCLSEGSRETMIFTIQVVLEGFGLFHYTNLKDNCQSEELKNVFQKILQDEVLHHGMGVNIIQNKSLEKESKDQIAEMTNRFIKDLTEAELVFKTLDRLTGGMTTEQKNEFTVEIDWHQQIKGRVDRLRGLLKKVGYDKIVSI